jgi:hypothetical protein
LEKKIFWKIFAKKWPNGNFLEYPVPFVRIEKKTHISAWTKVFASFVMFLTSKFMSSERDNSFLHTAGEIQSDGSFVELDAVASVLAQQLLSVELWCRQPALLLFWELFEIFRSGVDSRERWWEEATALNKSVWRSNRDVLAIGGESLRGDLPPRSEYKSLSSLSHGSNPLIPWIAGLLFRRVSTKNMARQTPMNLHSTQIVFESKLVICMGENVKKKP